MKIRYMLHAQCFMSPHNNFESIYFVHGVCCMTMVRYSAYWYGTSSAYSKYIHNSKEILSLPYTIRHSPFIRGNQENMQKMKKKKNRMSFFSYFQKFRFELLFWSFATTLAFLLLHFLTKCIYFIIVLVLMQQNS